MFDDYAHLKINGDVYTYSDYYDSIEVRFENVLFSALHYAWFEWLMDKTIRLEIGDDLTGYFTLTQVTIMHNRITFYKNIVPRNQPINVISWYNEGF
jgi:hypothetical protein